MMIVLACREAPAWASGTAVISGLGWMETFGSILIGLLMAWAALAGVCVCVCVWGGDWQEWDKKSEFM